MTKLIAWGQRVTREHTEQPPGNSLPFIDAVYDRPYDGLELDVQVSKDGHMVLMHDHTMDATTHRSGAVASLTARELGHVTLRDPWGGPVCVVETAENALKRNGQRGVVMLDSYHTNARTLAALKRAVANADFPERLLILLTYSGAGGRQLKAAFPEAVVLLKAPAGLQPPALGLGLVHDAEGLDGVLVPTAGFPEATLAFRQETRAVGLKLAVYLHSSTATDLADLIRLGADYVTSDAPATFAEARRLAGVV